MNKCTWKENQGPNQGKESQDSLFLNNWQWPIKIMLNTFNLSPLKIRLENFSSCTSWALPSRYCLQMSRESSHKDFPTCIFKNILPLTIFRCHLPSTWSLEWKTCFIHIQVSLHVYYQNCAQGKQSKHTDTIKHDIYQ